MMDNKQTLVSWFPWVGWNSEKLETWLEGKAAQGWHLSGTGIGWRFSFERGPGKQVRYCVDYQNEKSRDYRTIFEDAGWELIYDRIGWYIWRQEYSEERPEIFSDVDSLIERNKRLMLVTAACLLPSFSVVLGAGDFAAYSLARQILYTLVYAAWGIGTVSLASTYFHTQRLKERRR